MAINSQQNQNVSRTKPVTVSQAIGIANRQIWQREFNPHYDQVMLRISSAPLQGLRFGDPPPTVT